MAVQILRICLIRHKIIECTLSVTLYQKKSEGFHPEFLIPNS